MDLTAVARGVSAGAAQREANYLSALEPDQSSMRLIRKRHNVFAVHFSTWLLKRALYLNDFDLYKIYKVNLDSKPDRLSRLQQIYCSPKLRMPISHADKRRQSLGYITFLSLTYFLLRSLLTITIHYILIRVDQQGNQRACPSWWPTCSSSLSSVYEFIGDPLSEMGGEAIFFIGGLSNCLYLVLAVMPAYYTWNTLDLACIRLYFAPERELARLDATIELRLNELLQSLVAYRMLPSKGFSCYLSERLTLPDSRSLTWKLTEQNFQQLIRYKSRGFHSLRPQYFSEPNRVCAFVEASWITVILFGVFFWWMFFLAFPMTYMAIKTKCKAHGLAAQCSAWAAMDWKALVYLLEINVACWLLYVSFMLHVVVILILYKSNLRLVRGMHSDLETCLAILKWYNLADGGGDENALGSQTLRLAKEQPIDKTLLESLIKILVAAEELRQGTKTMTEILAPIFACSFVVAILTILVNGMSSAIFEIFKKQILLTYWLLINTFALLAASILSQFSQLQRLFCSIQAELLVRRHNRSMTRDSIDFISIVWRKLAIYSRATHHLHTAKPLFIRLTYKKIIELNFSIVSLVSLLFLSR